MSVSQSQFWAKLGRDGVYPDDAHPVICHCIDVGGCAQVLWDEGLSEGVKRHWSECVGLDETTTGRWTAFFSAVHDVGKVSPDFQYGRAPEPQKNAIRRSLGLSEMSGSRPHAEISGRALLPWLVETLKWLEPKARRVSQVVAGHHGIVPSHVDVKSSARDWHASRVELLDELARFFKVAELNRPQPRDGAWWLFLAGLISVADWLGSQKLQFPPAGIQVDLQAYVAGSQERCRSAVEATGWLNRDGGRADVVGLTDLFPFISEPRPLQTFVAEIATELADRPSLTIIEAPMGEGKTEAALFLADVFQHAAGRRGFYVALPTQATSNGMLPRIENFLAERYPRQSIDLQLIHGGASLSEAFEEMVRRSEDRALFNPVYGDDEEADESRGAVVAEAWFASDKRQALLAPFGVGTVDQAMLAVLQTKFHFVRLLGLSGRTVILDEVHAYDAYMSTIQSRLLRWLRSLGSPVVLLSATLPAGRRRELIAAWQGRNVDDVTIPDEAYPRVTSVTDAKSEPRAHHFAWNKALERTVRLGEVSASGLAEQLGKALSGGGCAAVICNTVGSAQRLFDDLCAAGFSPIDLPDDWSRNDPIPEGDLLLFHARFPFGRRQQIEEAVLRKFGKGEAIKTGTGSVQFEGTRPRCVLVATQVIEQSLDLDFDLMISEWAPVDLLLQRAGRLHRHFRTPRPEQVQTPRLLLVEPTELSASGVPSFGSFEDDGNGKGVYARHVLLRTWLVLKERSQIALPVDIEPLVEAVYADDWGEVPQEWGAVLRESREALEEQRSESCANAAGGLIMAPDYTRLLKQRSLGLDEDDPTTHDSLRARTREIDATVSIVLLQEIAGAVALIADHKAIDLELRPSLAQVKALLKSSVSLSQNHWCGHFSRQPVPSGWEKSGALRYHRPCILSDGGQYQNGRFALRYDRLRGVLMERTKNV
ncbi:CRISPR-associated helicase Cas3' [Stratiformator vulcanicus]|uniref:CRISPR-associated endonuclease/helicase Cas3 n=1 Tax=Stratiformator vulcanicus TaxID=2527980 RepID=A0A517R186_9PLAN|nr:CRISPR-associated helicase Cas3' [Stratiformator vulcanicus]QDT37594.1 CRISPR-associated endonuclease/helicase Cas3 [Stratiformator vulcanicus]